MSDIRFIKVADAVKLTGLPAQTIRVGLQQGVFPWGYAVRRKSTWTYYINEQKLIKAEGVNADLP